MGKHRRPDGVEPSLLVLPEGIHILQMEANSEACSVKKPESFEARSVADDNS
ncbi:hypothetical protein SEA_SCHWARTZ33_65 [Gordonia phage Schwartz33]|nr:hypothetical protein SEA_SCHWARTZ33_65 [Gordonia phage Schwartz33]